MFSADLQFRRANVRNTDGLGINPSPKLIHIIIQQAHSVTVIPFWWSAVSFSTSQMKVSRSTCVPNRWKQWTEQNILRGFSSYWQFPELIQYCICRISFHKNTQISCVSTILRVSILILISQTGDVVTTVNWSGEYSCFKEKKYAFWKCFILNNNASGLGKNRFTDWSTKFKWIHKCK